MNIQKTIIPISQARSQLGQLTKRLKKDRYFVLTKGGIPQAAIIDIDFLNQLQADLDQVYQKTYIDPQLLPKTRVFTQAEVARWEEADALQ